MKTKSIKCLFVCICIVTSSFAQVQDRIHNRKANTLLEFSLIEKYYNDVNKGSSAIPAVNIYTSTFGYMLLAESVDAKREISKEKLEALDMLFKALQFPHKASDIFKHEVMVKLENKKFWFPIQINLTEFWDKELKAKNKVLIYIRAYGSQKGHDEDRWLFTINSFNSDYYNGLWDIALESYNNGDSSNGVRCSKKLMELNPSDGRNYSLYGAYFYREGYPDNKNLLMKADSLYKISEKLSPDYGYLFYQKALVKFQLGEYKLAREAVEKAQELGVKNFEESFLEDLERIEKKN